MSILSLPIFVLLVSQPHNPAAASTEPNAQSHLIVPDGGCSPKPPSGGDASSKVADIVRRFNLAIICKDLESAMRLVAKDGTVSETEEYVGDDGKPVKWIGTGSWAEQLFLFTRPNSETSASDGEKVSLGTPEIVIDGSSAMVRQPLSTQSIDDPGNNACLIQHLMLAEDSQGWKIRHMMLVPRTNGCGPDRR